MANERVLAIPQRAIFLKTDLDILKKRFSVRTVSGFNRRNPLRGIVSIAEILIWTLWADLTFSWFAGIDAFWAVLFSKMFRKKSVVVASGFSVASMPKIKYGAMRGGISAHVAKFALKYADKLLAVSEFNKKEILRYAEAEKVELIYHGLDHDDFKPAGKKQSNLVITVGEVKSSNLTRKGLETFIRSARFLPDVEFVLIGRGVDSSAGYLNRIATPNIKFMGYISSNRLLKYYQRAKVYVQVSAHEAFGVALAEAMLCQCVPVVTERGALPEVVGDTGFYVPYGDPEATASAIKKALNCDKGREARRRIERLFPLQRRRRDLISKIEAVLGA